MSVVFVAVVSLLVATCAQALVIDADEFRNVEERGYNAWSQQLQNLDDKAASLIANFVGRADTEWKPRYGKKNRYAGVQPYADNRVKLQPFENEQNADDYINASELKLPQANRWYILTQAPMPTTIDDFWRMVYQKNVSSIVMLCDARSSSCRTSYWPNSTAHRTLEVPSGVRVEFVDEKRHPEASAIVTNLRVSRSDDDNAEPRNVVHYRYTDWEDFHVPSKIVLLKFLKLVQPALENTDSPTVVHCTGGVGRTGTFVLIDSSVSMARNGHDVSVSEQLQKLRQERYGLVETPAQLRFAYETIFTALDSNKEAN